MIVAAAIQALAQKDEGPILRPKTPVTKPAGATLLVICDLACNWKLDGKERGIIAAGDSAAAKVELGEHMVVATTEDGLDKLQQLIEVKAAGQKVVNLELQPVRDARLRAERQLAEEGVREKAAQEAQNKVIMEERDKAEREEQEKEKREHVIREVAGQAWTDTATNLMWSIKDNGSNVDWLQAYQYCIGRQLAGFSDWRLPTETELRSILDMNIATPGLCCGKQKVIWHVKGNLQLSGEVWSGKSEGDASGGNNYGKAIVFPFADLKTLHSPNLNDSRDARALCVRTFEVN